MANVDLRIQQIEAMASPNEVFARFPLDQDGSDAIASYRQTIARIIRGEDPRLLAIVGPCSIHDPKAALEYAQKLAVFAKEVEDQLFVVMRTYFEKPRTVGGWKGLILDPDMDGSYNIEGGISLARSLLVQITHMGLPVGCEVLDPIIVQYIDDLISWSSIGARTTESQVHRNLASGLSVPVGFKNSTSGELINAVYAVKSARSNASFIGMDKDGASKIFRTTGNDLGHLILRGGDDGPNYYEDDVEHARDLMEKEGLLPAIVVDCSHANSRKDHHRQKRVLRSIVDQVRWGEQSIRGFMLESNLFEGCQRIGEHPADLIYGVSVTDPCIGWDETVRILRRAYEILKDRTEDAPVL